MAFDGDSQIASAICSIGAAGASSARFTARNHPRPQPVKVLIFSTLKLKRYPPRADFVVRLEFAGDIKRRATGRILGHLCLVRRTRKILPAACPGADYFFAAVNGISPLSPSLIVPVILVSSTFAE